MYRCVVLIDACAACSASTLTPTPFAASLVMKLHLPEWLVAPSNPASRYMWISSWHMVFFENAPPFWDWNRAAQLSPCAA